MHRSLRRLAYLESWRIISSPPLVEQVSKPSWLMGKIRLPLLTNNESGNISESFQVIYLGDMHPHSPHQYVTLAMMTAWLVAWLIWRGWWSRRGRFLIGKALLILYWTVIIHLLLSIL